MAVVADVFDVLLLDKKTNEAIGSTTLQSAGIEFAVQESDVRGGRGNQLLGVLHSDRDININLSDINFRYEWIAKQLGQDVKTGAGVAYAVPKWYEVKTETSNKVITLDNAPSSIDSIALYDKDGAKLVKTTDFTTTTNKITITKTGINAGDLVEVRTYTYATDAKTQTIEIDNSVFANGVMAILETIEIDESTELATHTLQYQFDNALPSGNFTINTSSAREAQAYEFSLRVVKPKNGTKVGRSLRIPITP